jgi:hypothetical protein
VAAAGAEAAGAVAFAGGRITLSRTPTAQVDWFNTSDPSFPRSTGQLGAPRQGRIAASSLLRGTHVAFVGGYEGGVPTDKIEIFEAFGAAPAATLATERPGNSFSAVGIEDRLVVVGSTSPVIQVVDFSAGLATPKELYVCLEGSPIFQPLLLVFGPNILIATWSPSSGHVYDLRGNTSLALPNTTVNFPTGPGLYYGSGNGENTGVYLRQRSGFTVVGLWATYSGPSNFSLSSAGYSSAPTIPAACAPITTGISTAIPSPTTATTASLTTTGTGTGSTSGTKTSAATTWNRPHATAMIVPLAVLVLTLSFR